jgi:hypothetical protein
MQTTMERTSTETFTITADASNAHQLPPRVKLSVSLPCSHHFKVRRGVPATFGGPPGRSTGLEVWVRLPQGPNFPRVVSDGQTMRVLSAPPAAPDPFSAPAASTPPAPGFAHLTTAHTPRIRICYDKSLPPPEAEYMLRWVSPSGEKGAWSGVVQARRVVGEVGVAA